MKKEPITESTVKDVMDKNSCNLETAMNIISDGRWSCKIVNFKANKVKGKQMVTVISDDCDEPQVISWRFRNEIATISVPYMILQNLVSSAKRDVDASIDRCNFVPGMFIENPRKAYEVTGKIVYSPQMPGKCFTIFD